MKKKKNNNNNNNNNKIIISLVILYPIFDFFAVFWFFWITLSMARISPPNSFEKVLF